MNVKTEVNKPEKKKRTFLPPDFELSSWKQIEPFFINLDKRIISSVSELENWLLDLSELEAIYKEAQAWRYIRMTGDTGNKVFEDAFNYFASEIDPKAAPFFNAFNKKLIASPFSESLNPDEYRIYLRSVKKQLEIYREENIPLLTEIDLKSQEYGKIVGAISVNIHGEEMTLQKAASFLKSADRGLREETYRTMLEKRFVFREHLDELFDKLLKLRHQVAVNAGFKNYRDYTFATYGRFDYTADDCYRFHDSVAQEVTPIIYELDCERKKALQVDKLRPWDMEVDLTGLPALLPFRDSKELIELTCACFDLIDSDFGSYIRIMNELGHFDLDSRKGKAPGGYNYPMPEIGVPFIFMNSVGSVRDLVTIVHEGGHAIHSFLSHHLAITQNKNTPSEVAELASMSMELISMEHWEVFFPNPADLKRARLEQLEKVLDSLPWIALIDKFQHWMYTNPEHTPEQRKQTWVSFSAEFESKAIDFSGLEEGKAYAWHRQLHVFEVPFYYIEYGFAQLGAIALWRNYKKNPVLAIAQYKQALALGYTRTIGELYEAAGIHFQFSTDYVHELIGFVKSEIDKLK
jgi:oligoendopeptidase F